MKTIALDGVVGWDVMAADIRAQLADAGGDDIELVISSPGGSVYEGLAIYNAIRDYRRAGNNVSARVVGLAASMATYIPLAAQTITVEDNAVWMIHNPSMFAAGDRRAMAKAMQVLEGVATIITAAYQRRTKKDREELAAMMDDETYLYGQQIVDAGFADELIAAGDGAETEDEAVAIARTSVGAMVDKLKEESPEQFDKLAAMLVQPVQVVNIKEESSPVVDQVIPAAKAEKQQEGAMDIKALRNEHPDVFAQAVEIGVKQEQERVSALRSYVEADPANLMVTEVINEAIGNGKSVSDVNARLQVAIRDGGKQAGENPPIVGSATEHGPVLSDEERKMCKAMGLSVEDYIKHQGEAE